MIAALPMYDRPEIRGATDRFWSAIAARLDAARVAAPEALTRPDDPWEVWRSPDLLLAQTCGLPFRARLHRVTALVGTPDYGVPGCPPGWYRSVVVARAGVDSAGAAPRLAVNDGLSQSGWAAALDWLNAQGLRPASVVETGAHAASIRAVAEGRADLAAIDAVTWRLACLHAPREVEGVREIGRTAPRPGLPLVTASGRDAAALARGVSGAISDLDPGDREALGLRGLVRIPAETYLAIPIPPDPWAIAR